MNKIVLLAVAGALVWYGYANHQSRTATADETAALAQAGSSMPSALAETPQATFSCDGRTHCSQMRSCEEATYYIRNCPDTEMDGNGDGVPCERQWCR